jgi:hypothetical protein
MTVIGLVFAAAVWLFFVLFAVGLARAAARGDLVSRRALAVERARRRLREHGSRRLAA